MRDRVSVARHQREACHKPRIEKVGLACEVLTGCGGALGASTFFSPDPPGVPEVSSNNILELMDFSMDCSGNMKDSKIALCHKTIRIPYNF